MSYEQDLLNDFGSGLESEDDRIQSQQESQQESQPQHQPQHNHSTTLNNNNTNTKQLQHIIQNPLLHQHLLNQLTDEPGINPVSYLKVPQLIPEIESQLNSFNNEQESDLLQLISYSDYENDEYKFLLQINQIITLINYETEFLLKFITRQYSRIFPELATIVLNPFDYIKVIQLIKQDLKNIKDYEAPLREILTNDKILVVMMSGVKSNQDNSMNSISPISTEQFDIIMKACDMVMSLETLLNKLSTFIQGKLIKFTPNLSNLLGSITTAQLLINTGSLNQLCLIPSCNLPSLGVKELSTKTTGSTNAKSIQKGYLYQNDMIKYLPPNIIKPALRILSGKVILAARIDLSKTTPNGELGTKYHQEVVEKIDKLLTPPGSTMVKPLPKPSEFKSKRRGGKKLQKSKARFRASELAKAQNKMSFGNQEDSYINSFGEEVGLGMVKNSSHLSINPNTKAAVSKSMKSRLDTPNNERLNHLDSVLNDDFESIFKKSKEKNMKSESESTSKWLSTDMKK